MLASAPSNSAMAPRVPSQLPTAAQMAKKGDASSAVKPLGKKARKSASAAPAASVQKQPAAKRAVAAADQSDSAGAGIDSAIVADTSANMSGSTATDNAGNIARPVAAAVQAVSKADAQQGLKHPIKQQGFKIARDKERKEKLLKNLGQDVDARLAATSPEAVKSRNHRVFLAPPRLALDAQQRTSWGQQEHCGGANSVAEQLHAEILEYVDYTRSTVAAMTVHIEEMIANVRTSVCSLWAKARVEPFGSYSTGIWLPSSDVDLVILGVVEINNRMLTVKFLRQLAKTLESQSWVESILVLDSAKIPVLKLVTAESSVPIDITFESTATHSGLLARDLIKRYADEMPELYPLAVIFKQLLRERDLNDAYTGGLSSYSIVLMLIHFQQLWRGGGLCFKAAATFASGSPVPRPATLLQQEKLRAGDDKDMKTKSGSPTHDASKQATNATSPKATSSPAAPVPATPVSSYAAVVSKPKDVVKPASPQAATPTKPTTQQPAQPFSYAAVAAGIAKLTVKPAVPTAPVSYAAAVTTTKTRASNAPVPATRIVRMPIATPSTGTKTAPAADPAVDAASVTSSTADTEELSSYANSTATSTSEEVDDDAHDTDGADRAISLGELTMNILEFFGIIFDFRKNGLSVRDGGYIYRLAESSALGGKRAPSLVIEDPIHPDRNVSASSFAFSKVVTVLEDSFYALKYFHPTRFTPTALSCLLSVSGHTRHASTKPVATTSAAA